MIHRLTHKNRANAYKYLVTEVTQLYYYFSNHISHIRKIIKRKKRFTFRSHRLDYYLKTLFFYAFLCKLNCNTMCLLWYVVILLEVYKSA